MRMNVKQKQFPVRMISMATVFAIYAILYAFTHFHYELSDDVVLMRSFAGLVGGVYESFNGYTHTILAWPIHWLSMLFPAVTWFSVVQIALLAAASYIIVKSILCVVLEVWPFLLGGWVFAAGFLGCFVLAFLTGITYTTTTAVLGTAAVWRLLAVDFRESNARFIVEVVGSFLWLIASYALRQISVVPMLGFWLGAFACKAIFVQDISTGKKNRIQRLMASLTVCLLVLGGLAGIRAAEIRISGEKEYLDWMRARISCVDYGGIVNAGKAELDAAGWTENERRMAGNWYFLDEDMTTEAFEVLAQNTEMQTPLGAIKMIFGVLEKSRNMLYFALFLTFFCGASLICALLIEEKNIWAFIMPVGCAAAAGLEPWQGCQYSIFLGELEQSLKRLLCSFCAIRFAA